MWNWIKKAAKGVLIRLNLIKQVNNVTDFAAVIESENQYNLIQVWRDLYRGYLPSFHNPFSGKDETFHDINCHTLSGNRKRRLQTLNMPKILCETLTSLVFNQKCQVNISSGTPGEADTEGSTQPDPFAESVKNVLDDNHFLKNFAYRLEDCFAMGGLVIKPYFDGQKIKITFVTADSFLPLESTEDEIRSGVFINQISKGKKYYTLLEWHTWGALNADSTDVSNAPVYQIKSELYYSDSPSLLGTKVPLSTLFPNKDELVTINGLSHPLFVYLKPNLANNFELDSPLGVSVYANAVDTLRSLDIAFDSFQREFILGKRRILVPQTAVQSVIDPNTGEMHYYFDPNDEVYQAMANGLDAKDEQLIKDMSVELRVTDHIDAINAFLNILSAQLGFSAGTFAFSGGATVQTATQVISENSQTFRTKQSHETQIEKAIRELVDVVAQMAQLYDLFDVPDDYDVTVDFDDSVAEDRQANANFYLTLVNSNLMPKVEAIKRIFNMTDEQAQAWLAQIQVEQPQAGNIEDIIGGSDGGGSNADTVPAK